MRPAWPRSRQSDTRYHRLCSRCARIDLTSLLSDPLRTTPSPKGSTQIQTTLTAGEYPKSAARIPSQGVYVDDLEKQYDMGLIRRMSGRSKECPLCHLLLSALVKGGFTLDTNTDERTLRVGVSTLGYFELGASQVSGAALYSLSFDTHPGAFMSLGSVETRGSHAIMATAVPAPTVDNFIKSRASPGAKNRCGGRLRPSQINFQLIRIWLRLCQSEHGSLCHTPSSGPPLVFDRTKGGPTFASASCRLRFIDVVEGCLTHFSTGRFCRLRYVALSYVWGVDRQKIVLTRARKRRLFHRGSLDKLQLAQTIRDAIDLVRSILVRYLWVDSLCIVQDDSKDKTTQIPFMGSVYSNALFTIIAASGIHADAGLPGVRPNTRRRQEYVNLDRMAVMTASQPTRLINSHLLEDSVWQKRGWTFQEQILSKCFLIFYDEQVSWECQCASWCEDLQLEHVPEVRFEKYSSKDLRAVDGVSQARLKTMSRQDVCDRYVTLRQMYTSRQLTFGSDVLNAFAGILEVITIWTGEEFFWGHPCSDFDQWLCWDALYGSKRPGNDFPSWSWAAWTGVIYDRERNMISEVSCYRTNNSNAGKQECRLISKMPDDSEWREDERSRGSGGVDKVAGRVCNSPRSAEVQYPRTVTLKMVQARGLKKLPLPATYIYFWASSAKFHLIPRNPSGHRDTVPPYGALFRQGALSGQIGVCRDYPPNWLDDPTEPREFIRIACGTNHMMTRDVWDKNPSGDGHLRIQTKGFSQGRRPDVVQALGISWVDGIAFRETIATIDEECWLQAEKDWKLIVMG